MTQSRKELLDLGLRNPLINHRSRTKQIAVIDERSAEIFRILCVEGRTMTFNAMPDNTLVDSGGLTGMDSSMTPSPEDSRAAHNVDTRLQTSLDKAVLQRRLLSIHRDAKTHIEERGVNILFLALGFLSWYESSSAQEPRRAPLILVPVRLERSGVQGKFRLSFTGEEIGTNLSLVEKLRSEFDIEFPPLPDLESLDISEYYRHTRHAIKKIARWEIQSNEITLGFFSFGKFLMYKDLDPETWIDSKYLEPRVGSGKGVSIVDAVLGDGFNQVGSSFSDDEKIDDIVDPSKTFHIRDADSSQILAILDVMSGRNFVLQGPPGTGKSQTITNIIAEAVGHGKKVLFVSEKMAALDVVRKRLDESGLADAVLELHSHKTRKTALLKELGRTLERGKPIAGDHRSDFNKLQRLKTELNEYAAAVNEAINGTDTSFINALGHVLRHPLDEGMERLDFEAMSNWSESDYREARDRVEMLQRHIEEAGPPKSNPFFGCGLTEFLPSDRASLETALSEAAQGVDSLLSDAQSLRKTLNIDVPLTLEGVQKVLDSASLVLNRPELDGLNLATSDWIERETELTLLIETGHRLQELNQQFGEKFFGDAGKEELENMREVFVRQGNQWWRYISPTFRQAHTRLKNLYRRTLPKTSVEIITLIDVALDRQDLQATFRNLKPLGAELFGSRWQDRTSNWQKLSDLALWMNRLHRRIGAGELPDGILPLLGQNLDVNAISLLVENLKRSLEIQTTTSNQVAEILRMTSESGQSAGEEPLESQRDRYNLHRNEINRLFHWIRYRQIAENLQTANLGFILDAVQDRNLAHGALLRLFDHSWFSGLVEKAWTLHPGLRRFDRREHEETVSAFSRLDRLQFEHNRVRLIVKHWNELPQLEDVGELRILKRELNKKRRIMPIRRLLTEAGRAVQAIKPVFMMSPMSIATYAPPGSVHFDLVIFDEASQVRPVDAFGAILRGDQVVVVGDSKQLPPTSFFDSLVGPDEEEEFDNVGDMESILSLFLGKGAPERMLRWHYRSRHETLIAVSNQEFYENRLVVFPGPGNNPAARGLRMHHQPETTYDRGKSRTNRGEAAAVAKAVMEHARTSPHLTLGVVAFSTAQRDAIEFELETLRRRSPDSEPFFVENRHEAFFVKNLENVQGDERDVIFISIGYGKTREGFMTMNFGPLNRDGGERRLNVLITRARMAMDVFSNFTADDLDLDRGKARGVEALKTFLKFAETGRIDQPETTERAPDSPFEEAVISALRNRGLDVVPQVGTAGFFIDIGIRDPEKPGRYILGIECDGASYHSSRSARDRDRLRQEVLEGLGWTIHRIWSTSWFQNPERELERVLEAIESSRRKLRRSPSAAEKSRDDLTHEVTLLRRETALDPDAPTTRKSSYPRYRHAHLKIELQDTQLHELRPTELVPHILSILKIEAPIHRVELARRVAEAAGQRRTGARVRSAVERGVAEGCRQRRISIREDFVWLANQEDVPVRDRSNLDPGSKRLEFIAPEEIDRVLMEVVHRGYSATPTEAITEAARALGIHRLTKTSKLSFESRLNVLLDCGSLALTGENRLALVDTSRMQMAS